MLSDGISKAVGSKWAGLVSVHMHCPLGSQCQYVIQGVTIKTSNNPQLQVTSNYHPNQLYKSCELLILRTVLIVNHNLNFIGIVTATVLCITTKTRLQATT